MESVKAAADVFSPAAGVVTEVNVKLEESPELVNESPYDKGKNQVKSEVERPGHLAWLSNIVLVDIVL